MFKYRSTKYLFIYLLSPCYIQSVCWALGRLQRTMRHYLICSQRWFQITRINPSIEKPARDIITQRGKSRDPTGIKESFWEKIEFQLTLNLWKKFPDRPRQKNTVLVEEITHAEGQLLYRDHYTQLEFQNTKKWWGSEAGGDHLIKPLKDLLGVRTEF